jgi:peptidoglycan/xylan/chitin deacetylase (PgdA/CDA1 family)
MLSLSSRLHVAVDENFLRCLYCHYVFDDQVTDFRTLIDDLKSIGRFVDTATCIRMLEGEQEIDGKYFHLSFDDGFRNNFLNALPILLETDVPAIFFVTTTLVEAGLRETSRFCLETTEYRAPIEMLQWDDLREMVALGYEVGSHTMTHPRLSRVSGPGSLVEHEIVSSKLRIEDMIGIECKYLAWPYGKLSDINTQSLDIAARAGYQGCFSAFRGRIVPTRTDRYQIPRHHFEVQWPVSHVLYFARGNREVDQ